MARTEKLSNGLTRTYLPDGAYFDQEIMPDHVATADELASDARDWRNQELISSDWVIPLTDHPQHAAYVAYRKKLRDWPSTADFPAKKPVLE